MASGGFRPGAGRKKGSKDTKPRKRKGEKPKKATSKKPVDPEEQKIKKLLGYEQKAKTSFYQEYLHRVSKGEKLTLAEKKDMDKLGKELATTLLDEEEQTEAVAEDLDPLSYMLKVMNDPTEDKDRRDKMALNAAPYMHARRGEGLGKKEEQQKRVDAASKGKYAPGKAPLKRIK